MLDRYHDFVSGITVCYKYIQRIKNMEMTEFGLKGIHVSCLFYLYNHPQGLTAAQLCALCCEDKASVSRIVAQLRQRGFILPGSKKSYRELLRLSAAGQEIARQMEPVIAQWVCVGGEGLTEQEREHFYRSLALISANLHSRLDD